MSSKIRVLDEHTINKIAAGEVIENPASVIKELVENALDAEACSICVEIKGGGRQLIRVTDDGCGMSNDDALLCLERHATSKIRAVEDIHELLTMGFRGEAVPSIAAISKFSILTRQREKAGNEGTMVLVEGGKILKCCAVACSPGTTIEVKSLFFNVPVRKKFQKSPVYDTNEILKTLTLLALGYPHIKFRLISDQETLLSAPSPVSTIFLEQMKERIGTVLGGDYIENCVPIEGKRGDYHVQGWIGMPFQHRQNRTGQHLFINQRGIHSPIVSFAMKDGYGTTIPMQRHPIYVLHLTIPGELVDVNVHPQKREVRLRQELDLRDLLITCVREALQKNGGNSFLEEINASQVGGIDLPAVSPLLNPLSLMPMQPASALLPQKEERWTCTTPTQACAPPPQSALPARSSLAVELPLSMPALKKKVPLVIAAIPRYLILEAPPEGHRETQTGLCLVDQRAAHARVIYEKLCRHRQCQPLEIQYLLIPHTIDLPALEANSLRQHLPLLEGLGIHLKEFGRDSFLLDGLPEVMGNVDPAIFIHEIVTHLNSSDNFHTIDEHIDRRLAQAAVRASVSKDRRLSLSEGQALMQQLLECDAPWYCPQGKPTLVTLSAEEIHKHFA